MEIILYGLIFVIGTLFGSFFTLAVYRIPLGEDILLKRSFCPNCKAKLQFKDLIPILSYIALGGKCAYCGKKIRIRYLCLEILSGVVFLLLALSLKLDVFIFNINMLIYFLLLILYIASLFIIAGIDKERIVIQKALLIFGMVVSFIYMIYVCVQGNSLIYTYIIYLTLVIILMIVDTLILKKKLKESYVVKVIMLIIYMLMFSGADIVYLTVTMALLAVSINLLIKGIRKKIKSKITTKMKDGSLRIPIGFYLCVSNIVLILANNFLCNWVM